MAGNPNCQDEKKILCDRCITIELGKKKYEACLTYYNDPAKISYGIILTHGAGGDMNHKQLVGIAEKLAKAGYLVLRFTCKGLNLAYRTKVFTGIVDYVKENYPHLKGCFIGGRSMGSRAAVGVCCDSKMTDFLQGVICLSYPLHKPNDFKQLRDGPLYDVTKPVLFVSGTDDNMCDQELFLPVLDHMTKSQVHWIEGGNHGLEIKGKPSEDIVLEIDLVIRTFIQECLTDKLKRTKVQKAVKKKIKTQ
ncbi:Testis-expressed protein 30 [Mytilus edulis]|uniref:Testis-expressed protein 30 n=1 Tax=Mytilus edulis TaxID=6550 RepID=A0A8S3U5I9_MYTED|nr:Testis-expressed protein 30 [Mytilus edulis]